jgi:hypothetical protein
MQEAFAEAPATVGSVTRDVPEPSCATVLLLATLACFLFVVVIVSLTNFPALVDRFGDSSAYMRVASAIRHWNFRGLFVKQFWGLPYMMAAASLVTRISDRSSLLLLSFVPYFVAVTLAYRLWGGWIAALFLAINFDWTQRSCLGGSEPLFVALLFGSFLAVRHERWVLASLLAAIATVVRPLGFFALVGIGIVLLVRSDYGRLVRAVLVALLVGILYSLPLVLEFHDPLATVHSYRSPTSTAQPLFGIPFYAIIKGTLLYPAPWTSLLLTFGWILFVLAGTIAMVRTRSFHQYARSHPVEIIFAALYLISLFSYNSPYFARGNFSRFAIPIVPFVLLALNQWIPKSRKLLWSLAIICPVLAAASAIGIRNVSLLLFPIR